MRVILSVKAERDGRLTLSLSCSEDFKNFVLTHCTHLGKGYCPFSLQRHKVTHHQDIYRHGISLTRLQEVSYLVVPPHKHN